METPKALKKCYSTETSDTSFSSIFDSDDSPLSSPSSSVLGSTDDEASEYEDQMSQQHPEREVVPQDNGPWDDPKNRETASSQRERRVPKRRPVYSDFFSHSKEQTRQPLETKLQLAPTTTQAAVQAATATANARDDGNPAHRTLKPKEQATASNPAIVPLQKKVITAPARRNPQSKFDAEPTFAADVPQSTRLTPATNCTPSRQLRKRKLETTATEATQPPPPKRVKKTVPKAQPKPKGKSSCAPKRAAPPKLKKRSSGGQTTAATLPGERDSVVVLKMSPHKLAGLGHIEEDRTDEVPGSQHTIADPIETISFENTSFQSLQSDPDQCAQPVLAPIPASSQVTSIDDSQPAHIPFQPQKADLAAQESQTVSEACEVAASQNLPTSPCLHNRELGQEMSQFNEHGLSRLQPPLCMSENALYEPVKTCSFPTTQLTQLLSQPYSGSGLFKFLIVQGSYKTVPLPRLASPLPEPRHVDSDAASEATTVIEEEPMLTTVSVVLSQEQLHLHKVAEQLLANRQPGAKKPVPAGRPKVWAEGRQELCETLHYFRAYQSACYSTGGFVRGFMFDKVAHHRDYIDSDVVISRAGGGMIKDKDSNTMRSGNDQSEDTKIIQALKNCMKHYNPVVIMTGIDNPHMPSQPPHQYSVLDYFKPTDIWVEKSGKSKILRYRFEKLNTQKDSWWRPESDEDLIELGSVGPPVQHACQYCGETSKQVYLNGWMCLQSSCNAFWHLKDTSSVDSHKVAHEPDEASLIYDPRFLKQKTPWPNDNTELSLSFDAPEISAYALPGEDTSQAFWSGIVCPDCGRCNSRLSWMGWDCANPTCDYKLEPPHSLIPASSLHEPFWPLTENYTMSRDTHEPYVPVSVSFAHGYRINRYKVPGLDGFITHMIANRTILGEAGGPNAMFEELQQQDIDLRRRAMPNGQLKGESYCRHFSVNYGMPYKFIAATASHSFDQAVRPVTATRSRLNWAAKYLHAQEAARLVLAQETKKHIDQIDQIDNYNERLAQLATHLIQEIGRPIEFNEVLAMGYFESQKINYHDDGEFGLGPTIATLSLGAPGTMRIRMKARHYHGSSSAGVYDEARPLPGCSQYEARLALQPQLEALKLCDPKAYRARLKQIPKELKLKHSGHAKDVLKMELGHGDIVVMHGAELQKYYEHAVDHAGKLRFALTCRYIDPDSLKEADKPGYVVERDLGGYDGAKLC